jgi:6-phosphofructokinase 1
MVLETLGRDTGWVTAATALARGAEGDAPHLIYLPEAPVTLERICADVEVVLGRLGRCVLAVCEGLKDPSGNPFGAVVQADRDGVRRLAATLGHSLARSIGERLKIRARAEKPGLVGRCFGPLASEADRAASRRCGELAARAAADGATGVMATPQGELAALEAVAGQVREFPHHWISNGGNDVSREFVEWLEPIAGTVSSHARLPIL